MSTARCLPLPSTLPLSQDVSDSPLQRYDDDVDVFDPPFQHKPFIPDDAPHLIDWFDSTLKQPTSFIAEKTCEMFMHKLLETTQVGQSVIVLSLHYIWPLKERNRFTNGLPGSEFRIAVTALMMANKFLDEGVQYQPQRDPQNGEEFLTAVDFSLHVSGKQYASWLHLLKGLVLTKETESRKWRRELPPLKRPTGMTLQIPETSYHNCPSSGSSPLDSLYSLAKMSLSSPLHAQRSAQSVQSQPRLHVIEGRPQTLVAAYRVDRPVNSLYYYSLAGSSINGDSEQPKGNRKARLRCYQPPPQVPPPSYTVQQPPHTSLWISSRLLKLSSSNCGSAHTYKKVSPVERDQSLQLLPLRGNGTCAVPSAPFSNAGPPGVQFYAASSTPASQHLHLYHHHHASHHRSSLAYPSLHTQTYGQ
ncbi:hypothetical protein PISMIDRAFT_12173 [Pisolithus microcarpus 441]|uniref:Cyclin N-terminal domain-containing protein n=1 Tax=Pisolithus microcarpus 441 TaxID=765257 RepID=A0A0C9Z6F9_9AGAM|nr:hypothetical protein PISMIDRAFT_12173 [Pisolithus microcarpus 441]